MSLTASALICNKNAIDDSDGVAALVLMKLETKEKWTNRTAYSHYLCFICW
jgi:hypothetical protein